VENFTKILNLMDLEKACRKISECFTLNKKVYSTGIGSSEAHSKALEALFDKKVCHISPMALGTLDPEVDTLILISQNLSPNIICCLGERNFKNLILVTAADPNGHTLIKKRAEFIERVKENNGLFLCYPP
jgi:hypothetical protein